MGLYIYAVLKLEQIEEIEHKFLVQGHTQNEGDSCHSTIEKGIKRFLAKNNIFHPDQYIEIIENAKKTGAPFNVVRMSPSDFFEIKSMVELLNLNFKKLKVSQICSVKIRKGSPFVPLVKYSFAESYKEISLLKSNTRAERNPEFLRSTAGQLPLKNNKYQDLMYFYNHGLIPANFHDFYENLTSI